MPYRAVATSVDGLVQQLACSYLRHGYWFYVVGQVPEGKDPSEIDEKLIRKYGIDVSEMDGAGAAGGLAGGLAAIGGRLMGGFDLVADEVGLLERIEHADLVITGEGFLDEQSFEGKVVGGVVAMAASAGVPVLAVAGDVYDGVEDRIEVLSLTSRFGHERSMRDTSECISEIVLERLGHCQQS